MKMEPQFLGKALPEGQPPPACWLLLYPYPSPGTRAASRSGSPSAELRLGSTPRMLPSTANPQIYKRNQKSGFLCEISPSYGFQILATNSTFLFFFQLLSGIAHLRLGLAGSWFSAL